MPHQSAAIELRPIVQLLQDENGEQARYFIPSYQRGYRWNHIQVRQLLNDIWEFVQASDGRPRSSFYCLQPLVVKKLPDGSYEVVDGQQRLTTIHIILSRLGAMMTMLEKTSFHISYETRDEAFLRNIDLERSDENVDFYHMAEAWRAVDEWVNQHGAPHALKMLQHLLADDEIGHNVKVIWYELTPEDDAVAAFTRLNVGKIPLTESELIRALFLRKAGKEGTGSQLHIAYQWDRIEHRLQEDAFWYFLQNSADQTNRIGLLFDLVAQTWKDKANDDHAAFSYFSAALTERGADLVWKDVNNAFLALEEWFEDRHLYHVIGFLLHHSESSERDIGSLLQESRSMSKDAFQSSLRQRIFISLFGPAKPTDGETIADMVQEKCAAVEYRHSTRVRKLLLFFNIATLLHNEKSNIRFQFDSFKKHSWDMEHIRSVSDERPNSTGDRMNWLKECRAFLATATDDNAVQLTTEIDKYLQSKSVKPDDGAFEEIDSKILAYFGEAGEGGGNALSNLTLLDSRTNRGYKNAVFAIKRKILLEVDQAGTFVPLCTRNVFLKCYSDTVANVTLWRVEDANDYFNAICKTLTSYLESRTTFAQLIANRGQVQIPIIQRDYAQGRTEQKDVRDDFLHALHDALSWPADDARLPLDLDFVYGNDSSGAFQPLDGQQRLTTLFLLHWYLAWVDGKLDDFRGRFMADGRSRFGYQVRPSSRDFIDEMVGFNPDPFQPEIDLAALIRNQQWFVRAWQYDQTVRSALDMLGAMHIEFRQSSNLYERLIDPENPAVTFQLLDLEDFELTDELYIKMNARGKPLTHFETFKARFEQHLKANFAELKLPQSGLEPVNKFFAKRMDREWSDFFWHHRDKNTASFDAAIMNLLRVLIIVTRDPERGTITDAELAELRGDLPNTFMAFHERGWLDQSLVTALVSLLECWSGLDQHLPTHLPDDSPFDLGATFGRVINDHSRLTFQDLALFAGYVQFVTAAAGNIQRSAFGDWMRVVFNLAVNTDYNRNEDLRRSISGLASVGSRMSDINAYLTEPGAEIRGFSQPQVLEERLKARLFALGDGWHERITAAERHDYFKGQIGFLLKFAGFDLGEANREPMPPESAVAHDAIKAFDHYLACARQMLKDLMSSGNDGRAWELALLSLGNVLLEAGRNRALPSFKEGQVSWKRLLRVAAASEPQGDVVKDLWDKLPDPADAQEVLKQIIETEWDDESWRRVVIDTPAIFQYCDQGLIRFDEAGIYPLKKSQMNGKHVELYTFGVYVALQEVDALKSLAMEYHESFTADEPSLGLVCTIDGKRYEFLLMSRQDHKNYYLWLQQPQSPDALMAAHLAQEGFAIDDGFLSKTVESNGLQSAILDLDASLVDIVAQEVA